MSLFDTQGVRAFRICVFDAHTEQILILLPKFLSFLNNLFLFHFSNDVLLAFQHLFFLDCGFQFEQLLQL